ncbi:MAG: bacteriohemerythrin [Vicinamibacterales bacterium]
MTMPDQTPGPLGVEARDGEHRLQIELLDALRQAIDAGRPAGEVAELLDQLVEYSNAHFLAEQLVMRLHAYPLFEAHVQEHDRLIAQGRRLRDAVREGTTSTSLAVIDELRAWLLGHIDGMDRSYAEFTALEGVTPKV